MTMICATCNGPVFWMGPCGAQTHTQCSECGAINNQVPAEPVVDSEGGEPD